MATYFLGPTDLFIRRTLETARGNSMAGWTPYVGFLASGMTQSDGFGAAEIAAPAEYVRKPVSFLAASGRSMTQIASIIDWGNSSDAWNGNALINFYGYWDIASGGSIAANLMWVEQISPPFQVGGSGIHVFIAVSALKLSGSTRTANL
jgi:hypothetical protein